MQTDNRMIQTTLGLVLTVFVMLLGIYGAEIIGYGLKQIKVISTESATPISGIFVAIIIGMIIRNTIGVHEQFKSGITFSIKYMLRLGIVLLGLRLSLVDAFTVGLIGIPIIIACVLTGFLLTIWLTKKMNQSSRLGLLIGAGTSICGVTAIMATAPVLKAKENEIAYAVANITVFGVTAMVVYPFLANLLFTGDMMQTGLFFGTAIHDTAQVAGAALIYGEMFQADEVINIATVTKLTRNLFIVGMIPLISFFIMRNDASTEQGVKKPWYTYIPLFIIGFVLLSLVRTAGDYSLAQSGRAFTFWTSSTWETIYTGMSDFGTTYLLGMAMAAVGLSTDFKQFKGIGIKPFYIGFIAAIALGVVSISMIMIVSKFIL